MPFGPLQLVVVTFDEVVLPAIVGDRLNELRERGIVRLVDVALVAKDNDGELHEHQMTIRHNDDLGMAGMLSNALFGNGTDRTEHESFETGTGFLVSEHGEFGISPAEIDELADMIPRGKSVVLLLIQHLWMRELKQSIADASGRAIAHGWITPSRLITQSSNVLN